MMPEIRIANCSGFLGDRPSGAKEMVEGGPIDVLTGDWLAELTMLILSRIRAKRPGHGYARTFVTQMEEVMGTCLDRGIKVVSNAGGLNPEGCAEAVAEVASRLGLNPTIAFVHGDDLLPRMAELVDHLQPFDHRTSLGDLDDYITANAYLGCWGIVEALAAGADIVVTGRVTDAAVTCGPAAWFHAWTPADTDQLAGAVVAGHVIECSAQATGGNYSFFSEIVDPNPRLGFPWAAVAADGSSVIGKHDNTGGEVSIGTVTSQLLYEIGGPEYLGPDVTARFDTIALHPHGPDRVRISGVKGTPPPATLKVAMNQMGGYRNSFAVALTGLDIDAKAAFAEATFWDASPLAPEDFASTTSTVVRTDKPDPASQDEATAWWRLTVKDPEEIKVGRAFNDAVVQTALASIPGMYSAGSGPTGATPYGVYRPGLIDASQVDQTVHVLGGSSWVVRSDRPVSRPAPQPELSDSGVRSAVGSRSAEGSRYADDDGPTERQPLGVLVGARSGDKGGNANLGVFVRSETQWGWLDRFLSVERLRSLLPEISDLEIERHRLPNLWSLNFLIYGLLEEGVAASTRPDAQAKALGEWLR
ncbi:MAG: DUF1446 domain-containing protein, partial [Acidimicrobiales bacterium]|nr:DUF1446 domain-containing protein [Acidimicrobiales bacterium]